jgi:thioredoxin reductase
MQVPEIDAESFAAATVSTVVPLLVEFTAPWCPVCKQMEPVLGALAVERAGRLTVVKLDVEAHWEVADRYDIRGMPTFMVFAGGEPVLRVTGGRSLDVLRAEIDGALAAAEPESSDASGMSLVDVVGAPASVRAEPEVDRLPVGVIGAGPVGLAAAANLAERGVPFVVFEVGDEVGVSIREWGHVQLFSPWAYDVDPVGRRLLEASGWEAPDGEAYPTGRELVEQYLTPLAALPELAGSIRLHHRIVGITRDGMDKLRTEGRAEAPFVVHAETPQGMQRIRVRAVIDATGTWRSPNPLGASGFPAVGERSITNRVTSGIPDVAGADRVRFAGRRVAVVGSGHSAQNVVRDLAGLSVRHPGTEVTWVIRRTEPGRMFGGDAADQLPERGRLGADSRRLVEGGRVRLAAGFRVDRVVERDGGVVLVAADGREAGPFDEVVTATGFRPDVSFLSELRVDLDAVVESSRALAPLIDPNVHSCGSVPPHGAAELAHPEPGLYLVGAKSYGRAPTFLLATGYEQVRSVVADLAGDHVAARDVRLVLPETGVCSRQVPAPATVGAKSACCRSAPAPVPALVRDASGVDDGAVACCG